MSKESPLRAHSLILLSASQSTTQMKPTAYCIHLHTPSRGHQECSRSGSEQEKHLDLISPLVCSRQGT